MISISENNYNMALILKIKEQTETKKLKKIIKNLRNLAEEDLKGFAELKIKIFEEEKVEEKKQELKTVAPTVGFQHYFEDFKKTNLKSEVNNIVEYEGENTPSTVDDNEEEVKQIDSSDFSDDE